MRSTNELVPVDAITSTITLALSNARRQGDPWKMYAEQHLAWMEVLLNRTRKLSMTIFAQYSCAAADMQTMDRKCVQLIESLAEAIWEVRQQDTQDPLVAILSPGTPSFFFEWAVGHQADRVEAVAEFLEPFLVENIEGHAALVAVRGILPEYRAACERAQALHCKLEVFEKMVESVARLGHVQYSRLRRRMRAEGFDPFDVRRVFPDIPGSSIAGTLT